MLLSRRARQSSYAGIACLYTLLTASEKIHAENYKRILDAMGITPEVIPACHRANLS